MTRQTLVAFAAAALLSWPAMAAGADASSTRGHGVVRRNCSQCHAVEARGASRDPRAPPFRELHTRYDLQNLQEGLAEGILTGHPAMPEFRFNPREIRDVIAYLKSLEPRARAAIARAPSG